MLLFPCSLSTMGEPIEANERLSTGWKGLWIRPCVLMVSINGAHHRGMQEVGIRASPGKGSSILNTPM